MIEKTSDEIVCRSCGGSNFTLLSEHEDRGSFFFGPAPGPRTVVVLQCECGVKCAKVTAHDDSRKLSN